MVIQGACARAHCCDVRFQHSAGAPWRCRLDLCACNWYLWPRTLISKMHAFRLHCNLETGRQMPSHPSSTGHSRPARGTRRLLHNCSLVTTGSLGRRGRRFSLGFHWLAILMSSMRDLSIDAIRCVTHRIGRWRWLKRALLFLDYDDCVTLRSWLRLRVALGPLFLQHPLLLRRATANIHSCT